MTTQSRVLPRSCARAVLEKRAVYRRPAREVCRTGSHRSRRGLNRRGAILGIDPAAAPLRYSRSTSRISATGGSSKDAGAGTRTRPSRAARESRIPEIRFPPIPGIRARRPSWAAASRCFERVDSEIAVERSANRRPMPGTVARSASASVSPRSRSSIARRPVTTRSRIAREIVRPTPGRRSRPSSPSIEKMSATLRSSARTVRAALVQAPTRNGSAPWAATSRPISSRCPATCSLTARGGRALIAASPASGEKLSAAAAPPFHRPLRSAAASGTRSESAVLRRTRSRRPLRRRRRGSRPRCAGNPRFDARRGLRLPARPRSRRSGAPTPRRSRRGKEVPETSFWAPRSGESSSMSTSHPSCRRLNSSKNAGQRRRGISWVRVRIVFVSMFELRIQESLRESRNARCVCPKRLEEREKSGRSGPPPGRSRSLARRTVRCADRP